MVLNPTNPETCRTLPVVCINGIVKSRGTNGCCMPVSGGFCVPRGQLPDVQTGTVRIGRHQLPAQIEVLNRWQDGSVRWMLVSFVCPEINGHTTAVEIFANPAERIHRTPQRLRQSEMSPVPSSHLTQVTVHGSEIKVTLRDPGNDPPTERIIHLNPVLRDQYDRELQLEVTDLRDEVTGAVRQTFVISARVRSCPFVTIQFRLTIWPDAQALNVETRIRNTRRARHPGGLWDLGDAGSFCFRSFEISVRSDEIPADARTHWKAERAGVVRTTQSEIFLHQAGSGGPNWSSSNHIRCDGRIEPEFRGYEARCESGSLRGYRAEPAICVEGDGSQLTLAVPEFWQQFPSSLAAAMGTVEAGLFPVLSHGLHELQGGEQKTLSFWLSVRNAQDAVQSLDWVYDSPRMLQDVHEITTSAVLPWFSVAAVPREVAPAVVPQHSAQPGAPGFTAARFARYLTDATSGNFGLDERRAKIDEYGWRNFGDIPADHEQRHYAGLNTVVSHYNNQFDLIFGGILQLLATQDLKWFDLFDPLARHVMDIDLYHTNQDRAAFNGGLFWHTDHYVDARDCTHRTYSRQNQPLDQPYGGGPGCEHNYTTGLLHYYFLTGSLEARESVMSLADWVLQMDDGSTTLLGLFDRGPTGAATATASEDFHGPGRGAGNSINALLDAWILTGSERYLQKLEELIRRCIHPDQNPYDLDMLDAEIRWSYSVFLNSLGRYLLTKGEAGLFDAMYSYARGSLKNYGRWMVRNEGRTLAHAERLKYPTEAWAAQDLRKANVLRIAAMCEDDPAMIVAMQQKADEISDAAWADFQAFGAASLTARCLAIVLTEGHREVFHRSGEVLPIPPCSAQFPQGVWKMFVPQKQRVKALFKSPAGLLRASVAVLNPSRIVSTVRALRRQF